jgi:hypothetical protein
MRAGTGVNAVMSKRDYAVVVSLAILMFLAGHYVLEQITDESTSSVYGTLMVVVFALYTAYVGRRRDKSDK